MKENGKKTNKYKELKKKQQKEFNDFPMFFAFDQKQFDEGMKKLGLRPNEAGKILKLSDSGGYFKKEDEKKLDEFFSKNRKELKEAIENDKTGEGFICDMFKYELRNHEYGYTRDLEETLESLDLTRKMINENKKFKKGLELAIKHIEKSESQEEDMEMER